VFSSNEEGFAEVISEIVPPGREESVQRAAIGCPERAIVLSGV
jgi:ferredoxin